MSFIALDVGASTTRFCGSRGDIEVIPNNITEITFDKESKLEANSPNIEECLEVIIETDNKQGIFPKRILVGSIADRYKSAQSRPSIMDNKYKQDVNYISAIVSTALSCYKSGINGEFPLYWALPPVEVDIAKPEINRKIIGNYAVTFPKFNNLKVNFGITENIIYEEPFMALLNYFFDENGILREDSTEYTKGRVLSLDLGASTTNLGIADNLVYLEKSGQTYKTGGNVAREFLVDDVRERFGFDLPNDMAEKAIAEGRLQIGNTFVDIGDLVESAKSKLAKQIVNQVQSYFRKVDIPIQSLRAIIVSGGGSMSGQYLDEEGKMHVTSKPMSFHITNALSNICPGVDVVYNHYNPRLAVINGLRLKARLDIHRKQNAI